MQFPFSPIPTPGCICTNRFKRKVLPFLRLLFRKRVRTSPNQVVLRCRLNGMPKSPESQDMPSYSTASADWFAENIMRSMEKKSSQR
jgi:hypothetical protein